MTEQDKLLLLERVRDFFAEHTAMGIEEEIKLEHNVVDAIYEFYKASIEKWIEEEDILNSIDKVTSTFEPTGDGKIFFEWGISLCKDIISWDEDAIDDMLETMSKIVEIDEEEEDYIMWVSD